MDPIPSTTPNPVPSPSVSPELQSLPGQFRRLLRAFAVLSVLFATLQVLEVWRCWNAREGAQRAGQLRTMLGQVMSATEEFRRVAVGHPDLVAIGRKYGLEPLPPTGAGTAPAPANPPVRP